MTKQFHNDFQELCAPFIDRGGTDITSAPPLFPTSKTHLQGRLGLSMKNRCRYSIFCA
ncbi:MAG: hypothetical protein SOV38_08485 [Prevotella sp.]|nr:hypothetical protein [Prevotella sp.]